jgi:hypothetical protein
MEAKKVTSDSELKSYANDLNYVIANKFPFLVWQMDEVLKERRIFPCLLKEFDPENCLLRLAEGNNNDFQLPSPKLYVFIEEAKIIFKAQILSAPQIPKNELLLGIPDEIKKVQESEVNQLRDSFYNSLKNYYFQKGFKTPNISEDYYSNSTISGHRDRELFAKELGLVRLEEEDRKFASLRESPRTRPQKDKKVHVSLVDDPKVKDECLLWDMSTGGMGIITTKLELYEKGKMVYIRGFDNHMFDHSIQGQVMSTKYLDDLSTQAKIGIKFNK